MDYWEYSNIGCKRILLAAENETCNRRLCSYLSEEEYLVEMSGSGEDVVRRLTGEAFDLCIIDYGLTGTPFHVIVEQLATVLCYTPIVLMVSNGKCAITKTVASVAPIYKLVKPFTISDFGSVVCAVVGRTCVTVTTRHHRKIPS